MMYPLPTWEINTEEKKKYRKHLREAMIQYALSQGIASERYNLVVRQLLSEDLGLKSWRTPPQDKYAVSTWVDILVLPQRVIGLCKVIQLSKRPKVSTLRIGFGKTMATIAAIYELDELYSLLPILHKISEHSNKEYIQSIFGKVEDIRMEAYFSEPIVAMPDTFLQVQVCSLEGNKQGDRLMLGGFVVEPRDMTII